MIATAPLLIQRNGEGSPLSAEIAGSKAAQIDRMIRLGLNVPAAFVLPTSLCSPVNRGNDEALATLAKALRDGIHFLEETTGRQLGDKRSPLLVSVRSGAAKSMPGMLATVLDVGLNADSVHGLIGLTGNPRLAWDCYRRFIQNYAEVVAGAPAGRFEDFVTAMIRAEDVRQENELDSEALERLTRQFLTLAAGTLGCVIPDDPFVQLEAAARAIYGSWENPRAAEYRRLNHLESLQGTAVTIQTMVFGNAGGTSGAGVAFSRNPATGAKEIYADFLLDAQGEDVVAGRRPAGDAALLTTRLPEAAKALFDGIARLEQEFRDMQDVEFTVENGELYFLQTRSAKRTPRAALRVAVDFVHEGLIDTKTALARVDEIDLDRARVSRFTCKTKAVATGLSACPGVASGRLVLDSERAKVLAAEKHPVILVRHDTSTDDIAGFAVADGILTAVGGRTAHAAVVARQLGKVCVVGCHDLRFSADGRTVEIGGTSVGEGDWISLDGETGEVMIGQLDIVSDLPAGDLAEVAAWRDGVKP